MEYADIKNVKKPVARLIFGTSMPAFFKGEDKSDYLDELFEMGITTFDTARVYGEAESVLGKWMQSRGNREKLVILTKGGHPALFIPRLTERAIRKDFFTSCQKLNTDYIDIYLLHRDNPKIPAGNFVEILNALVAEGKIGAIGGSNWTHKRIEEANEYAYKNNLVPFTVSSPYFGLANMKGDPFGNGTVSISGPQNENAREWYKKAAISVCPFASLGGGFFSGRVNSSKDMKGWARRGFATEENFERLSRTREIAAAKGCSVSQLALSWLFNNDIKPFAIVSSSSGSRMKENIKALEIEITKDEADYINLTK